jgi:hypothetical protein
MPESYLRHLSPRARVEPRVPPAQQKLQTLQLPRRPPAHGPQATDASASPKPTKSPKRTPPPSPKSHGLSAAGGVPLGGDSTQPQTEDSPQPILHVAETLAKDPDIIKVRFDIGRFITVAVNIEEEREDIQAPRSDLESASLWINISIFFLSHITAFILILTLLFQKVIRHCQS